MQSSFGSKQFKFSTFFGPEGLITNGFLIPSNKGRSSQREYNNSNRMDYLMDVLHTLVVHVG